jgi:hypothetical protein
MSKGEPKHQFDFAGGEDDSAVRKMLRDISIPGAVSITMTREPNFFLGSTIEGDVHQTTILKDESKERVVLMGSRSERDAYINGKLARLGYLSQLRVDPKFRGGTGVMHAGFESLKKKHDIGSVAFYVTTIIADNEKAKKALASNWPGMPRYLEREILTSLSIPLRARKVDCPAGIEIRRATPDDAPEIAACLQRVLQEFQFAPHWTVESLLDQERTRDLVIEDFTVATKAKKICGCVARWNQQGFKQNMVNGYQGYLKVVRPAVNLVGKYFGIPYLPDPGQAFKSIFLSHLAIDADCQSALISLLMTACNQALEDGHQTATIGMADRNPWLSMIRKSFKGFVYDSLIYTVHWPDDEAHVLKLDDRVPHLELAVL